jgi:hypothetical protein
MASVTPYPSPHPEPDGDWEASLLGDVWSSPARPPATRWGHWKLRKSDWTLVHTGRYPNGYRIGYEIDLEEICTSAVMLDWIFQLIGAKTWMTVQDGADLIQAFREIFHPQANLCSWGGSLKIDAPRFLRERFRESRL